MTDLPLYPFPGDEILHPAGLPDDFNPRADSYFALGELPEPDRRTFDGHEHVNPWRLVLRTPLRGSQALLVNDGDMTAFMAIALTALARDDSGMYGPKDEGTVVINPDYWEHMTGVNVEVNE